MYEIKKRIYLNFDKTQKSAICNNLRALVRQNLNLPSSEILDKFVEDENYYLTQNASRFPFLAEIIDSNEFLSDTELYIKECIKYYKYKETQKPIIEAQKEFEKKKRKFIQEVKMSKEAPTQKQIYYYKKLCKRYGLEIKDTSELSKLDLRNEIDGILNEYSETNKDIN
jgi:predicted RNA-binding protein with RPS1 domain